MNCFLFFLFFSWRNHQTTLQACLQPIHRAQHGSVQLPWRYNKSSPLLHPDIRPRAQCERLWLKMKDKLVENQKLGNNELLFRLFHMPSFCRSCIQLFCPPPCSQSCCGCVPQAVYFNHFSHAHTGLKKWVEVGNSGVFRPEMLLPMGLPEDVSVIAWGLSLER